MPNLIERLKITLDAHRAVEAEIKVEGILFATGDSVVLYGNIGSDNIKVNKERAVIIIRELRRVFDLK